MVSSYFPEYEAQFFHVCQKWHKEQIKVIWHIQPKNIDSYQKPHFEGG